VSRIQARSGTVFHITEQRASLATGESLRTLGLLRGLREIGVRVVEMTVASASGPLAFRHAQYATEQRTSELLRSLDVQPGVHDVVHVSGLPLAPLVRGLTRACPATPVVLDVCDSWHRLYERLPAEATLRHRLGRLSVQALMRGPVRAAHGLVYISERDVAHDARHFAGLPPRAVVANGVDETLLGCSLPTTRDRRVLLAGDWAYPPNAEGLQWFFTAVWPHLHGGVEAIVTGPTAPRFELPAGATFGGYVQPKAAMYEGVGMSVAPLLSGAGVKNKGLESLAAGRPVVSTSEGASGLPAGPWLRVVDDPQGFAAACLGLVQRAEPTTLAAQARRSVQACTWTAAGESLLRFYVAVRR
jgi:polysaccharide biosynthesis protein PslH